MTTFIIICPYSGHNFMAFISSSQSVIFVLILIQMNIHTLKFPFDGTTCWWHQFQSILATVHCSGHLHICRTTFSLLEISLKIWRWQVILMEKLGLDIYKELAESFGSIRVALYYRLYWPCTNPTHPRIRADNCSSKFTTELSCKLFCLVNESTNHSDGMHLNLFKMINVPKLSFSKSYKVLPIIWSFSCRGVGKEWVWVQQQMRTFFQSRMGGVARSVHVLAHVTIFKNLKQGVLAFGCGEFSQQMSSGWI